MAAKEIIVKKYVVRLSGGEREQLATLIRKGKSPAQRLMKARILLKADVSSDYGPRRTALAVSSLKRFQCSVPARRIYAFRPAIAALRSQRDNGH